MIFARRYISSIMLDVPFVYSIMDMITTFTSESIGGVEMLRGVSIIGQFLTTIIYWAALHPNSVIDLEANPFEWLRWTLMHGLPLITLLLQQLVDPYYYD